MVYPVDSENVLYYVYNETILIEDEHYLNSPYARSGLDVLSVKLDKKTFFSRSNFKAKILRWYLLSYA